MLPVEAATAKYNMEQQKLNDLSVKSKTIIEQEANSWAVRMDSLKNTQASEETIKTKKEKFNRVIAQTARNLKLVAAAQLELNRIRARATLIGSGKFFDELKQREELDRLEAQIRRGTDDPEFKKQAESAGIPSSSFDSLLEEQKNTLREGRLSLGEGSFKDAFLSSLQETKEAATQWTQEVGGIMGNAFVSLTDGIGDAAAQILVMGADAKTVFKSLAQTILAEVVGSFAKLGAQMVVNAVLGGSLQKALDVGAAASLPIWTALASAVSLATSGANSVGALAGMAAVKAFSFFAKGGIFDGPTAFAHSGGLGVMGEAGPEAVMPLRRDSQGRLGVAAGGGKKEKSGNTVSITIDARGSEVGVEEKIGQVLSEVLPLAMAQASDLAVIRIRNDLGRGGI